ncbi:hypothetical protein EX30DRAFT_364800 [Ascodesmis nigricans]|uniref:Uncharacterized protein n=1 Tax=Ascodesmis nigricans TaxID=341454 RepID=A0A4S2MU27_9PEZI|nr:hypothetical protein EX30DRAFT_364800 [Ascodesmis nigricans]
MCNAATTPPPWHPQTLSCLLGCFSFSPSALILESFGQPVSTSTVTIPVIQSKAEVENGGDKRGRLKRWKTDDNGRIVRSVFSHGTYEASSPTPKAVPHNRPSA